MKRPPDNREVRPAGVTNGESNYGLRAPAACEMSTLCTAGGCRRKQGIHVAHASAAGANFQEDPHKTWGFELHILCLGSPENPEPGRQRRHPSDAPGRFPKLAKIHVIVRELSNPEFSHIQRTSFPCLPHKLRKVEAFLRVPHWIFSPFESSRYSLKAVFFVGSVGDHQRKVGPAPLQVPEVSLPGNVPTEI